MKKIVLALLLLSADFGFGQVTYVPVAIAFPQIAIGGDPAGQNYVTLLQIVNNNSSSTVGHFAIYSDTGSPLPALFDGQGPQSTMDIALASGETRQIQLTLDGPVTGGWLQVNYAPSNAMTTAILQYRSGAILLSEVGVQPAFSTIGATDFAAETDITLNTGIAIANPSPASAYVLITLWDPGTGAPLANALASLPPNGHLAKFLTELFPAVSDITQIRAELSLDSCSTPSCIGPGNGFLATALRLNGDQFTTIPVADRPEGGDQVRILPQVAFGGSPDALNMKTVLYFTTNVPTGAFGAAEIFDDAGNPLVASADGAAPSSVFTFGVPGNRVSRVVLSGGQTLLSGWIRLTLSSSVHLIASAVFQTFSGLNLVSEASVLESAPITRGLIYVQAESGLANVGVAFANSQPTPNTIRFELFNHEGFVFGVRDITLPARGHLAQFVTELFPEMSPSSGFDGALSIRGSTPFSALALRLSGDKVATLPVAPDGMYRPSIAVLRITSTQRSPAQVNFEIDVTDFDSDIASGFSTTVAANAVIDFGTAGYDLGPFSMDGTGLLNTPSGTLSGSFQPPHLTGTVPSGVTAVLYINLQDSAGNFSNSISVPVRF